MVEGKLSKSLLFTEFTYDTTAYIKNKQLMIQTQAVKLNQKKKNAKNYQTNCGFTNTLCSPVGLLTRTEVSWKPRNLQLHIQRENSTIHQKKKEKPFTLNKWASFFPYKDHSTLVKCSKIKSIILEGGNIRPKMGKLLPVIKK